MLIFLLLDFARYKIFFNRLILLNETFQFHENRSEKNSAFMSYFSNQLKLLFFIFNEYISLFLLFLILKYLILILF